MTILREFQWADFRWILVILPLCHAQSSSDTLLSVPKEPVHVWIGSSSVMLPCSASAPLTDFRELRWHRPGPAGYKKPVLLYENQQVQLSSADPLYRDRVALVGDPQKGNFSLRLQNITLADGGEFVCFVDEKGGFTKESVELVVKAMGSSPLLSPKFRGNGQVNVTCSSHGWSPEPSLTWRDSQSREVPTNVTHISTDAQGFTSVTSWLQYSTSDSDWLSCSVGVSDAQMRESRVSLHNSEESLRLVESEGTTDPFLGLFVFVLLLLGVSWAVMGVLYYRKHKAREYGAVRTNDTAGGEGVQLRDADQVRIVLVGKTGVGKGATGNTILGRKAFQSDSRGGTAGSTKQEGQVNDKWLCVVDTPDLFGKVKHKDKKIAECFARSSPGPHVFLIVLSAGMYSAEEGETVNNIKKEFGDNADKHTIVLFTHGDKLKGKPIKDFIKESEYHEALEDLIGQCHDRCHVFTNDGRSDRTQVNELLDMIDLVKREQGGHFTSERYQKVEEEIKHRTTDLTTWIEEQVLVRHE